MNTDILNKFSDKKFARLTQQDMVEAGAAVDAAVAEIEALPDEQKGAALGTKFGFLQDTILHLAAKCGNEEAVVKILQMVLDRNQEVVNARNGGLFTALHFAAHSGDALVAHALIEAGAETNPQASVENRRWTPIHYAAQFGHAGVVEALINAGVDKETVTGFGLTPLVIAAEFGKLEVLQHMLSINANKNAQTIEANHCMNALHYAVVGNFRDVTIALLKAGIERNQKTNSGMDALDFAVEANNAAMVSLLLSWGIGNLHEALKSAEGYGSKEVAGQIKNYSAAHKNIFDSGWMKTHDGELLADLKKFTEDNLDQDKVMLSFNTTFNAYGILALKHKVGLFTKS
ncbi:MAG: hypothetical protein FJX34_03080, partial [Alphaproteobacteria bacterium]|nr:hypothetical protein [Alphaproteobacteria bacterium]